MEFLLHNMIVTTETQARTLAASLVVHFDCESPRVALVTPPTHSPYTHKFIHVVSHFRSCIPLIPPGTAFLPIKLPPIVSCIASSSTTRLYHCCSIPYTFYQVLLTYTLSAFPLSCPYQVSLGFQDLQLTSFEKYYCCNIFLMLQIKQRVQLIPPV